MNVLTGLLFGLLAFFSPHVKAAPIRTVMPPKILAHISVTPPSPTPSPLPSSSHLDLLPTYALLPTPTTKPTVPPTPYETQVTSEWGKAVKIGDDAYTMNVAMDDTMATPREIFQALNDYRASKGVHPLQWSDILAAYAQGGSDFYNPQGLFSHERLRNYIEKEDGSAKLGFSGIGENGSYGYILQAVHLIEWVFASDAGHDSNQLDSHWQSVGVGVTGTTVDIIFGGN